MTNEFGFWDYPVFHIVNYALSVVMLTCFGRFLLGFLVAPDSQNYIWKWFRFLTDWAIAAVRPITPGFMHPVFMPLVAAFWLLVARYLWFIIAGAAGLRPTLIGSGLVN